jgi:hypothetical protein
MIPIFNVFFYNVSCLYYTASTDMIVNAERVGNNTEGTGRDLF